MKNYVIYDASGAILQSGACPATMLSLQVSTGRMLLEGDGRGDIHYVVDGKLAERPASPAVLAGGVVLNRLPIPCTIYINSKAYPCNEDHCDLQFTYPGTYVIVVTAFPYLDAIFEVIHEN